MENLNAESIERLRTVFNQMKDSRRQLRPILSDIASSIDKGFFIDAGSEEVTTLLHQILEAQEQFSEVEQIKKAVNTKRLDQLDRTISTLEQNTKRDEINQVLDKLQTIEVNSDDTTILDSVRKVQLQAERLKHKSGKLDMSNFSREAEKFLLLAEIVENIEHFSPEEYLKVVNAFSDNVLIAMILTQHLVRFPSPVEEVEVVEELNPENFITEAELTEVAKNFSIEPNAHRVKATATKFDKVKPNLDLIVAEEKDFNVEKVNNKKPLTFKSFNNKLHELLKNCDPVSLFKILIKTRIMFKEFPTALNLEDRFNKNLVALYPVLLERLYNWGVVDKITWRNVEFYFLNVTGLDLALRSFTRNPSPVTKEDYFHAMRHAIQLALPLMAESAVGKKLNFEYMKVLPVARAELKPLTETENPQIVMMFSLILLGDKWQYNIAKFKMVIERELNADFDIKAVIIFAFSKTDIKWLKMFETVKFKKLNFFLYTLDGLFDNSGKAISFEEMKKICDIDTSAEPEKSTAHLSTAQKMFKAAVQENSDRAQKLAELKVKESELKKLKDKELELRKRLAEQMKLAEKLQHHFDDVALENAEQDSFDDDDAEDDFNASGSEENFLTIEEPAEPDLFEDDDEENFVEEVEETVEEVVEPVKVAEPVKTAAPVKKIVETPVVEVATNGGELTKVDSLTNATNLFKAGALGRGMLSLHALTDHISRTEPDNENWAEYLTNEIGFILGDPLTLNRLRINNVDTFSFWTFEIEIPNANIGNTFEYLNLAAMIKNFYAPKNPTSYQIQKSWNQINEDKSNTALKFCPAAKTLISLFNSFTEKTHLSFAECISDEEENVEESYRRAMAQIKDATTMADSVLHSDVNHRRVKDLIQQIFNYNGFVRKYLAVDNYKPEEILSFCRQFEELDLGKIYNDNAPYDEAEIFSEDKIGDYLDDVWDKPNVHLVHGKNEPFKGPKRKKVTTVVTQILIALFNLICAKKKISVTKNSGNRAAPVKQAKVVLDDLKKQILRLEKKANLGQIIFREFIENLGKAFNNEAAAVSYESCLLGAKYLELENDLPVLDSFGVQEFSLRSRTAEFESDIKYKKPEENLQKAYETALKNYDYGILYSLARHFFEQLKTTEDDLKRKLSGLERQVDRQIERIYNDFLNDLELARNYSRITDQEKIDFYINAALSAKKHFLHTKNAGIFQRFINACNNSINKVSIPQKNALTKRLEKLEDSLEMELEPNETLETRYPILANVRRQIDLMNLTVAEDYMNRLETEGGNLLTELDVADSDLAVLENFLSEYEVLLRAVNNANGSVEGAFKQRLQHTNRVNRETQNAIDFTHGWQGIHSGQSAAIETSIIDILKHLGYDGGVISARNVDSMNKKSYTVTFTEPIKIRETYPHPFAVFGTEIYSKGLEVIYLGSNRKFDNIAQVLSEMTVDRGTICFLDNVMTLPERRSLARIMKLSTILKNIIVIDKVMALYLARFDDANRGKKMLQTALPFARVQPYTAGGFVAPEMFIGRSEELDQIRDMSGPVFVYGGRQLGKSALLRQVKSIEHNPARLNYAFFIDLKNLNGESTLKKIVYELRTAKLIGEVETWQEFSLEMHKLLNGQLRGVYKPNKLLLLMDESDTFLSEKDSEKAIDILRELLVAFNGQFKFVLAGLHKVIRFEQNSGFGNLNHISVLPFKPSDAMELLVKPMSYLGFHIVDDGLISAIFSRTNYYPGSIQYYCKMLVDAAGNNYTKQKFDVAKNPPYLLDDDYLKNMLGNREFQEEIDRKFQITLHLDDDNYYEIIALAVAMIYYEHNRPVGVEIKDIRNTCLMCGADKVADLPDAELLSLLDEMVALNLLRRTEDGKFEFNRYAFWHMLGTETEVNAKLDAYGLNKN